jgi:uncharacterized membrane protein
MKLHLFFIDLMIISFTSMQVYSMQQNVESKVPNYIVRTVACVASSAVAGGSLGFGSLCLCGALGGASHTLGCKDLAHTFGSVISVPAMLVGSFATYPAFLSMGVKDKTAAKVSGTIFGVSMLINALSHLINLQNQNCEKSLCIGMGVFTGLVGLATLGICHKK